MNSFKFRFLKNIVFLLVFCFNTVAFATEDSQQSDDFDYDYIFEQSKFERSHYLKIILYY